MGFWNLRHMKMMTTVLMLLVEEELAPQKSGRAVELDSLEPRIRLPAQMAVMRDQTAGYRLLLRAFGYSLA